MDFITDNLLALILFSPAVVALGMVFLPSGEKSLLRWTALIGSLIPLALSLVLWGLRKGRSR